jgi:8-oxo-dGTP pyrophosphatase MutT (NUDIX family)
VTGALHADALRVLAALVPDDPGQEALRRQFLAHLRAHPDALWRSCAPDHLTASALVLHADRTAVLLGLHRKVGRWLQFGGHLEPTDRTLAGTALREATEESGVAGLALVGDRPVRLDAHPAPCDPGRVERHLDVQYLAVAPPGASPSTSTESHDVRWFAVDDLPAGTDPSVRALVAAARRTAG